MSIADDARIWFPASQGPEDGLGRRIGPSPSSSLDLDQDSDLPAILHDAASDRRTAGHSWVAGREGLRFFAIAPIVPPGRNRIGTLEVMDRKPRRNVTATQIELLRGLAATIAQLLHSRVTSLEAIRVLRAGHAAETSRRDDAQNRAAQLSQETTAARDRQRPEWCQLGGSKSCDEPAQLKIADSWGDTAWGCWMHAEEALVQVPSTFLAAQIESEVSLNSFRYRQTRH